MLHLDLLEVTRGKVEKTDLEKHPNMERFIISPLPKGFGNTVANSLRRVLLSSIPGAAITSVRINDIVHEFTTLPGIKQNALHLILGLKNIHFRYTKEGMFVINLSAKKTGQVKAGDFTLPEGIEITNPDLVIADLTDSKAVLNIEAVVEVGLGYRERDNSLRDEIGRMPLDADFSPVNIVRYEVDKTRVGDVMDLDAVTIDVSTDGTINATEAMQKALDSLKELYGNLQAVAAVLKAAPVKKKAKKAVKAVKTVKKAAKAKKK